MTDPRSSSAPPGDANAGEPSGARAPGPRPLAPGLYIVATPIGNLRDITLRALDVLAGADRVFAEDTRVTHKLLSAHGLGARLDSYHEHNEARAGAAALAALEAGERVALVSDAGTPLISDPGYRLVRAAIAAGHPVFPIPGPSAGLAALCAAGLPSDRFLFAGFLPAKAGPRARAIGEVADVRATRVFYESGPRLAESLAALAAALGPRDGVVARELTKLFEEFRRDRLDALAAHYARAPAPKGEIVILVGPPEGVDTPDPDEVDAALKTALAHLSVKDAADEIAQRFALPRRDVYARALALKDEL